MKNKLFIWILSLLLVSSYTYALDPKISGSHCGLVFQTPITLSAKRAVSEIKELNFGTYNVLNLEFSPGRYVYDEALGQKVFKPAMIKKPEWQLDGIAKAIKEENLDIVVLQEVEGLEPLKYFNNKYFKNAYQEILIEGNDGRGINIGFLIKKDLPLKIHVETHKDITWVDPLKAELGEKKLFSRDVPVLHIRRLDTSDLDAPDLIVMGTHYKSQRDRAGDVGSAILRKAQVEKTVEIADFYQKQYGKKINIVMAGDFNGDIHRNPEFKSLFESKVFQDSFDVLGKKIDPKDRVTHTFHPRGGNTEYNQLDGVLVNPNASKAVKDVKVYRYKDEAGKVKPLPKTWDERETNPSDHFMLKTVFDFQKLFGRN